MSDRIDTSYCANSLAAALHRGMKAGHISLVDIDCIRAACIGYLAANLMDIGKDATEVFIDVTLRKFVEKAA